MSFRALFLSLVLVFFSFVLQRLNLYGWFATAQVPWVYLASAFLLLHSPTRFGLIAALVIGLLLDVESMQLLGFNMLGLTLLVTSIRVFHHRLLLAGWPLIIISIPLIIFAIRCFGYLVLWVLGVDITFDLWWPLLALFLVWPMFYAILQTLRIKLNL